MHQFLKTILTTTCFTLALTAVHASDDEGSGVDLSSLLGGGNQSQQPTIQVFFYKTYLKTVRANPQIN